MHITLTALRQQMLKLSVVTILLALNSVFTLATVFAGDLNPEVEARLKRDLTYLASDELEGRGVGLAGLDKAADYVRDQFQAAGLKVDAVNGGAFQPFQIPLPPKMGAVNTLEIVGPEGKKFQAVVGTDFSPQSFSGSGAFHGELVFGGYGIEANDKNYNDFEGIDLKGKVVVIMRRVPLQVLSNGPFSAPRGGVSQHGELRTKINLAVSKGAAAILLVNDPYSAKDEHRKVQQSLAKIAQNLAEAVVAASTVDPNNADEVQKAKAKVNEAMAKYQDTKGKTPSEPTDEVMKFGYGGNQQLGAIPVFHVTMKFCNEFLSAATEKKLADFEESIDSTRQPASRVLTGWQAGGVASIERAETTVKNVIAVLEGKGPLANETIIVGAHYDHVGRGGQGSRAPGSTEIHNGADDNGSGTIAILEVARRLAARPEKLERRVVFIAFTAEELGLIGSAQYTKEPVFPLEQTVSMYNLDMVGRMSANKLITYGTKTSPLYEPWLTTFGKEQLGLDMVYKPEGIGPSDHTSFYLKKIPVLHFFSDFHPDYHTPTDDTDKINFDGIGKIVDLTEKLVVETAKLEIRPEFVQVDVPRQNSGGPRPYFGSVPDFGSNKAGLELSGVAEGGPADKGGLKAGDVIVEFNKLKIANIEDFQAALVQHKPGDTVDVVVERGNQKLTLKVTLDKPR